MKPSFVRRACRLFACAVVLAATAATFGTPRADAAVPIDPRRQCSFPSHAAESTVVTRWNVVLLEAVCQGETRPTVVARGLFMLHTAMYDAWTVYDPVAQPLYWKEALDHRADSAPGTGPEKAEAVSFAAFEVLAELFPDYQWRLFEQIANEGYSEDKLSDPETGSPAWIGREAGRAVLAARAGDGSNAARGYVDTTGYRPVNPPGRPLPEIDPNRWQPLMVPAFEPSEGTYDFDDPVAQSFVTPHWPAVRPFALASADQFRPPAPPRRGGEDIYVDGEGDRSSHHEAWVRQFTEVKDLQAALTTRQKIIAQVWSQDGPYYALPPGHWNWFAAGISLRDDHGIDADVKMFFALNGVMLDASIAVWDAKVNHDFIRPATAIPYHFRGSEIEGWRGPGNGMGTIPATEWRPYQWPSVVSPAHAEFPSGHSVFAAAGARMLLLFTGSDRFHDPDVMVGDFNGDGIEEPVGAQTIPAGEGLFEPGMPDEAVTLTWPTFSDAAAECGISRLYAGVHIRDSMIHGATLGRSVATQAYTRAERLWRGAENAGTAE